MSDIMQVLDRAIEEFEGFARTCSGWRTPKESCAHCEALAADAKDLRALLAICREVTP